MRIVEKVLYGLGGLLALMLFFIALCHYNPELAIKIGAALGADAAEETMETIEPVAIVEDVGNDMLMANVIVPVGELSAAESAMTVDGDGGMKAAESAMTVDGDGGTKAAGSQLSIPTKVAGLSGYVPVKATGTEITQVQADEIASELSKGETGSSLTFDAQMYPYYEMINDTQKALYRQIYANANAQNKHFAPVEDITANDLKNAFTSVVNDHPELFWVNTEYKYKYTPKGSVADITLVFNITANDLDASKAEFEEAAKRIMDETYGSYTDYDKERISHDTLISNVKYDANAPMNQSAYSALVYGRTVCAGYARALQYVLQQMGIPCYYVTGFAGENHAWNIVKLDDGFYNVDSTWDDTNPNTYDYFNCSDADYASDHERRDLSIYLPACNGNKYSGLEVAPSETQPAEPSATTTTTTTTTNQTTTNQTTTNQTTTDQTTTSNTDSITVVTVRGGGDEDYIDNIEDYYKECFASMIGKDERVISFDIIITDEKLWKSIYKAYDKGECQEGYIDRYLVEKHKNSCSMSVEAIQRTDGSYLLRHRAVIN